MIGASSAADARFSPSSTQISDSAATTDRATSWRRCSSTSPAPHTRMKAGARTVSAQIPSSTAVAAAKRSSPSIDNVVQGDPAVGRASSPSGRPGSPSYLTFCDRQTTTADVFSNRSRRQPRRRLKFVSSPARAYGSQEQAERCSSRRGGPSVSRLRQRPEPASRLKAELQRAPLSLNRRNSNRRNSSNQFPPARDSNWASAGSRSAKGSVSGRMRTAVESFSGYDWPTS